MLIFVREGENESKNRFASPTKNSSVPSGEPLIFIFVQNRGNESKSRFALTDKKFKRHFHFCLKRGKCERKPFRLEPKKKFKQNLRNL
jgi:hypothetical protein